MDRRVSGPKRDLLTAEEVCEYLRVSDDTLNGLIEAGKFPPAFMVSKGRKLWDWMDTIAYKHMSQRIPGFLGETKPAKT